MPDRPRRLRGWRCLRYIAPKRHYGNAHYGNVMSSFRKSVNALCATLPGAALSDPWGEGHDAWKVGGKLFAVQGSNPGLSVKCADIDTAQMLIEAGVARQARYFHRSWVFLGEETDLDEVTHRVVSSYDLVRSKLTKTAQASLPPRAS